MRVAQEHSPTKEKLLDAAQRLMLAKGFAATSVEEICDKAGLTKGSLFHYFDSKEELGKATLERFCQTMQGHMREASFHKEPDPRKRLYAYLDFMIATSKDPSMPNSCLLGNFSQELSETHPAIRSCCAEQFHTWSKALKQDLDAARAKYLRRSSLDTGSLAEHVIAVMEGSLILAKAKQDRRVIERSLRHLKRYLESLFGK